MKILGVFLMDTKFELGYAKQIPNSRWRHIVSIWFPYIYTENKKRSKFTKQFLTFMTDEYGPESKRWSLRWTYSGAEVRFESDSDAAHFIMLHTRDHHLPNMQSFYKSNVRGH